MATTVTLKQSGGSTLSSALNPITNRKIVENGQGTATTPGTTGFDVVTLKSANDAAFAAATAPAPIRLGVDNIEFRTLLYPESF